MLRLLGRLGQKLTGKWGAITTHWAAADLEKSIWHACVKILSQGSPHEMLEVQLQDIINATKREGWIIVNHDVSIWEETISSWDVLKDASIVSGEIDKIIQQDGKPISTRVTIEKWVKVTVDSKKWTSKEFEVTMSDFKTLIKKALQQGVNIVIADDRNKI